MINLKKCNYLKLTVFDITNRKQAIIQAKSIIIKAIFRRKRDAN